MNKQIARVMVLTMLCFGVAPLAVAQNEAVLEVAITVERFIELDMHEGDNLELTIDGTGEHESAPLSFRVVTNDTYWIEVVAAQDHVQEIPVAVLNNGHAIAYEATVHLDTHNGDDRTLQIEEGSLRPKKYVADNFTREMAIVVKSDPEWIIGDEHEIAPAGVYTTKAFLEVWLTPS